MQKTFLRVEVRCKNSQGLRSSHLSRKAHISPNSLTIDSRPAETFQLIQKPSQPNYHGIMCMQVLELPL